MRAREIIQEDYNQSLQSDVLNLLVQVKANGAQQVQTSALVKQLRNMGYAVDQNSILSLLTGNPMVMNATPEMVMITPPEGSDQENSGEDPAEKVSDMAQDATDIG
jgi:hypothetical protein